MAHSDIFIFLNTITWVFFVFFIIYLFFTLFLIPNFFKKIIFRNLYDTFLLWSTFIRVVDLFSSLVIQRDFFKSLSNFWVALLKRYNKYRRSVRLFSLGYVKNAILFTSVNSFLNKKEFIRKNLSEIIKFIKKD